MHWRVYLVQTKDAEDIFIYLFTYLCFYIYLCIYHSVYLIATLVSAKVKTSNHNSFFGSKSINGIQTKVRQCLVHCIFTILFKI